MQSCSVNVWCHCHKPRIFVDFVKITKIKTMEAMCRICMGKPKALINIFDGTPPQSTASIVDMISQYTGISVSKGDSLPETVCSSCLHDVQSAFEVKHTYDNSPVYQKQLQKEEEGPQQTEFFTITELKCEQIDSEVQNEGVPEDVTHDLQPCGNYTNFQVKNEPIDENSVEEEDCEVEVQSDWQVKSEEFDYVETEDDDKDYIDEGDDLSKDGLKGEETPFKCSHCTKTFSDRRKFKKHINYHNMKKPYKCTECSKSFLSPSNLENHIRTHTGEKPFKCSQCPKSYTERSSLKLHFLCHTGERSHKCPHCAKSFTTSSSLRIHIRTHTGERSFQCTQCPEAFLTRYSRDKHYSVHAEASSESLAGSEVFQCTHCPRTFFKESLLKQHIRYYSMEKTYKHKCPLCPMSFTSKYSLQEHTSDTHTIPDPEALKCTYCSKTFHKESMLKNHIINYCSKRTRKCSLCPMSFPSKYYLKQHIRTHSGEPPLHTRFGTQFTKSYKCSHCPKWYSSKENLKRHNILSHSVSLERPTGSGRALKEEDPLL